VGILGCENIEGGTLEVPVIYGGEYQIHSERCNYYENKKFGGTQVLSFDYKKLMEGKPENDQSCIFDVKVFISGMDKGLRGQFILANATAKWAKFKTFKQSFEGIGWIQLKEGTSLENKIEFELTEPGIIFWEGCQKRGEMHYASNPAIALNQIFDTYATVKDSCILNVGVLPDNVHTEVQFAKVSLSVFDKSSVSLSEPIIKQTGKYLRVEADPVVAAIGINDHFRIKKGNGIKNFKAKVDPSKEAFVRIITANGRYMLLKVKDGVVTWKNYIQW
jgi:hypothetical protein